MESLEPMMINQNDIQARLVLGSNMTSSCNMQTETDADADLAENASNTNKVQPAINQNEEVALYRDNFVEMLTKTKHGTKRKVKNYIQKEDKDAIMDTSQELHNFFK